MIESEFFFHHISLADGYLKNQGLIETIYKTLDIYEMLLNHDIEFNKTYLNTILSKLIEMFKNCDNQTRFMINRLIYKYQDKFSEIFVKSDIANSIIQVLTCNDSTSRFYAIQLTKYLPFLYEHRMDLIYTVVDLLTNKSTIEEKKEIIEILEKRNKKLYFYKVFIVEIVENFEEIIISFKDCDLQLKFIKLVKDCLKTLDLNKAILLYNALNNFIISNYTTERRTIISFSLLIMYIISKNHNFPEKFKVIYQIIQNEILNNLLEESKFYILLTAFYFIEMTHISEFLLSNKTVILKNIREILQKSYIFKYCYLGMINYIFFLANQNIEVEQLLSQIKDSALRLDSKYLLKLIYKNDYNENTVKIFEYIDVERSLCISIKDIFILTEILNKMDESTFFPILNKLVDVYHLSSKSILFLIKKLKRDLIKNKSLESVIFKKNDPILQIHYLYLRTNEHHRIKELCLGTSDHTLKYKMLKITLFYNDYTNLNTYVESFVTNLKGNVNIDMFNFYKEYFMYLSKSVTTFNKSTNYFTKNDKIDIKNEDFTFNLFKLKMLKYSSLGLDEINTFTKEFISSPASIVRAFVNILSLSLKSKVDVKSVINTINLLLNSKNICLINKEKLTKNVLAIKMFYLKYHDVEITFNEETRLKLFNEIHLMISRIIKYYLVFNELIAFKYDIKNNFQKEIIEKKRDSFNLYIHTTLKGLSNYNIDAIQFTINVIAKQEETLKSKTMMITLSDTDKISFSKGFSFKLSIKEKIEMKVAIEIYYIFNDSLKFKFISILEKIE